MRPPTSADGIVAYRSLLGFSRLKVKAFQGFRGLGIYGSGVCGLGIWGIGGLGLRGLGFRMNRFSCSLKEP